MVADMDRILADDFVLVTVWENLHKSCLLGSAEQTRRLRTSRGYAAPSTSQTFFCVSIPQLLPRCFGPQGTEDGKRSIISFG